jgi:pimeloyl-ACP methyl ester carboxylesterase
MQKTLIFIHGMFQNPKSWANWTSFFNQRGYNCIAPAWPCHEGEPEELRHNIPHGLGDLRLETIVQEMEGVIGTLPEKPVVIGHSVGGLIVQLLANKGLISAGVPISSVAPNAMLSFDWEFFKNSFSIANPFKGDEPFYMTPEGFHDAFCNTLDEVAAKAEYEKTATHDSRNVLRDCMMEPGHVDLELPHAPLLFIAGEKDHIIPHGLVEKNSKAYSEESGTAAFREFENRSHYICGEPGWEEVAEYVYAWLQANNLTPAYQQTFSGEING